MMLTDLLMIDRERRVADIVFADAGYGSANKVTLSGNDQWSVDHASSDPVGDIVDAIEKMIVRPTHMLMGSEVWKELRTHKAILKSVNRNDGDAGIASRRTVSDLLEVEIVVGQAWINSAGRGQDATLSRVWGKHALLYRADPNADAMGPPTLGITAEYRGREVMTGFNVKTGRGGRTRSVWSIPATRGSSPTAPDICSATPLPERASDDKAQYHRDDPHPV